MYGFMSTLYYSAQLKLTLTLPGNSTDYCTLYIRLAFSPLSPQCYDPVPVVYSMPTLLYSTILLCGEGLFRLGDSTM